MIEAMTDYYQQYNSNVHRGVHALSARATTEYEDARVKVARFVNAASPENIVFTRNATEAINLVANTWGASALEAGDEVILSVAEHHSNIVPWQLLAEKKGIVLKFVRLDENQELDMNHLEDLTTERTKLISLVHISNMLGCHLPVDTVVRIARKSNARVLLDACQSIANIPINVQKLGVDWIVGSAHKMCGPTGIGFLWGTTEALESMPPWMGGGEMIDVVTLEKTTFAAPPSRFEAGTPAIAEAIGFGRACDFMTEIGMQNVDAYEKVLGARLHTALADIGEGLTVYGPSFDRSRGPWQRSMWRASTRQTSAPSWTRAALLSGLGTCARSRCMPYLVCPHPSGQAHTCTTRSKRWTPLLPHSRTRLAFSERWECERDAAFRIPQAFVVYIYRMFIYI